MAEHIVPVPPGTGAPDFTLRDGRGVSILLPSLRGHPVVLAFYPFDWEPVSREQLTLYQDYLVEVARFSACLLGISIDHPWSHEAFARDARIRFPLLSDFLPRGAVSRLYGVYEEREEVSARALFVIDRQGIIRFSQAYPRPLNPGVDDLLTTLEAMAPGEESTG